MVWLWHSRWRGASRTFNMIRLPKDRFFEKIERQELALTYADIRLKTTYSEVMPHEVSLETKFSRNISLHIPIVSAAMDTVTEYEMAIELAKLGGIGVIHRNLTREERAKQVARVKRHLSGLIADPIYAFADETIEQILARRSEKGYSFHTFPVLDRERKLVGILTQNDFDFCMDKTTLAAAVMSSDPITGKKETSIAEAFDIMSQEKKKVLPLIDEAGLLCGMYVLTDVRRIITGKNGSYNVDKNNRLRVAAAIGVGDDALADVETLVRESIDAVVIDTAHADTKGVYETLRRIKAQYTSLDVVVGNISEPESAKRLLDAGADGIKVGQGPGSICTTRIVAGVGCPQVTAVYNCAKILRDSDVPLCADGGLQHSGDIPVAIGLGASYVMMGGMLAGTREAPGELVLKDGRQWKTFRGMGSLGALQESQASRERYRQHDKDAPLIPEGVEGMVPYQGELHDVVLQYLGGLRSGMGYTGSATIKELQAKADFRRPSKSGIQEGHPSVEMTREPPNYSKGQQ
ncbi:MAG: IMP dehydrogenase [Nanoarchaeota archaeon]